MSHYINKSVFEGDGFSQEGVWVLVGTPTGLKIGNDVITAGASSAKDGYDVKTIADSTEKKISFKDACIAGFASTENGLKLNDDGKGNVQIEFPFSNESKVFFDVTSEESGIGIYATSLAFATLKKENGKVLFYSEGEEEISLTTRALGIYNNIWGERDNSLQDGYALDSIHVFGEYFEKILLVYDLSMSSATAVNMFNYTGFSVGNAIINLSGLDKIFND